MNDRSSYSMCIEVVNDEDENDVKKCIDSGINENADRVRHNEG